MIVFRILKKFQSILNKHQKLRVIELTLMMILGGFMEMLSVSLMLPFMNAVMKPEVTMKKWYAKLFCRIFHIGSDETRKFLIVLAIVLAVLYIVKNLYLLLQNNFQYRFVYNNMFYTQQKLLHNYLHRPYEFFLSVETGEVIRVIQSDTRETFIALTSLLGIFTELVVTVILILTLLLIAPTITIGISVILAIAVFIILYVIKPILVRAGKNNQKSAAGMNKWMMQSIQGIKEVKVMQKENYFEKEFSVNGQSYVNTTRISMVLNLFPRFFIEAVSMASIFIMMAIMIGMGADLVSLIPTLSALAMASVRLLPAVNRISSGVGDLAFREPMIDKMIQNMSAIQVAETEPSGQDDNRIVPLDKQFGLSHISYHYPKADENHYVLEDVSMTVYKGESVGIMGPSGAGKTTAIDVLLGLLRPQKGVVSIDGTDITIDRKNWLGQIGYIPQSIFMLDGDIRENVAFGIDKDDIDENQVWNALEEASLADFVKSLPEGLHTQLGERGIRLSGGQRQRIGIARALYTNPSILIFDEATSALDNETEKAIMESVNHLHGHKTMVIIAHRLTTIEDCDHVYEVKDKRITRVR